MIGKLVVLLSCFLAFFACPLAEAEELPVVMLAGFSSRVKHVGSIAVSQEEVLSAFGSELSVELAGDPRYRFFDMDQTIAEAREDEASLLEMLGEGKIDTKLSEEADYILFGYLTDMSETKAQTGVLLLSGKDKTIHLEFSLRVMDAHTGRIVYTTTASSKRKSELVYHTPIYKNDKGQEDAVAAACSVAAQNMARQIREAL